MHYLFGDSHTQVFRDLPDVEVHHRGAVSMHRYGRDGITLDFQPKPGDTVIVSCGEIDIRMFFMRQLAKGRSAEEIIDTLVTKYCASLQSLRQDGVALWALGAPPPSRLGSIPAELGWPCVGSNEDRVRYTRELNAALERECARCGLGYLDQYQYCADAEGLLFPEMTGDGVHIHGSFGVGQKVITQKDQKEKHRG